MAVFDGKTHQRISAGAELASTVPADSDVKPKTLVQSGGKKSELFGEKKRTPELLKKYWQIYSQGGLYAQAIDTYAYATFANGYRLEGDESSIQEVEANLSQFDFDTVGMQAIIQSLIFGDSFQEAVATRGNGGKPGMILIRDSGTFSIDSDERGIVKSYTQTLPDTKPIKLKPEQIIHMQLIPSGDLYGLSLIGRAYDDIIRDTKTAEATAEAIDRHGFKKWHIKIGQPGELVKQEVVADVSKQFESITSKNEFTTSADVEIKDIDEGGLEKMEDYSNVSLMRVAGALGIPEEAVGIRRGSTDATAVSRMEFWLKTKISAIQRTVARTYTLQYINRLIEPGKVKMVFNDVSEEDEATRAKWVGGLISSLAQSNVEVLPQVFEVFPKVWIQKQFGIDGSLVSPIVPKKIEAKPAKVAV